MNAFGKKPASASFCIDQLSGNRGTGQNGQRMRNNDVQIEGAHTNVAVVYYLSNLVGVTVELKVNSGTTYEGIFRTFSSNLEIVLDFAHPVDMKRSNKSLSLKDTVPQLIVNFDDVSHIYAKNVDLKYGERDSFTDSAISSRAQNNGIDDSKPKVLVEWSGDGPDQDGVGGLGEENPNNRFTPEEMFRKNKTAFGVKSSYNVNMEIYTTRLEHEDTDEYRQRLANADRLAREIEESASSRKNMQLENGDEELRYSAVHRPHVHHEPQNKYPHSALRNKSTPDNSVNGKRGTPHAHSDQRQKMPNKPSPTSERDLKNFHKKFVLAEGAKEQVKGKEMTNTKAVEQKSQKSPVKDLNKSPKRPTDGAPIQPAVGPTTGQPPRQQNILNPKVEPNKQNPGAQSSSVNSTTNSPVAQEDIPSSNKITSTPTTPTESAPKTSSKLNPNAKEFTPNPNAKEFKPLPSAAAASTPVSKQTATVSVLNAGNTRPDVPNSVIGASLVNPSGPSYVIVPSTGHLPTSMPPPRPSLQRPPSYTADGQLIHPHPIYHGANTAGPMVTGLAPHNLPTPPSTYGQLPQGQSAPHPATSMAAMNPQQNPTVNYHTHQGANQMMYGQVGNGQPPQQPIHNNQSPAPTGSPAPQAQSIPVTGPIVHHQLAYPGQYPGAYGFQVPPPLQAPGPAPGFVMALNQMPPHYTPAVPHTMHQFPPYQHHNGAGQFYQQ